VALNIKDEHTDRIVRELAAVTGESITVAVETAARERLQRLHGVGSREQRLQAMREIACRSAARPVLDSRSEDEILGYDEHGLPS
jgi:antitoxin VapB